MATPRFCSLFWAVLLGCAVTGHGLSRFTPVSLDNTIYRATPYQITLPSGDIIKLDGDGHALDPAISILFISDSFLIINTTASYIELIAIDASRNQLAHTLFYPAKSAAGVNHTCNVSVYYNDAFQYTFASTTAIRTFIYAALDAVNRVFGSVGVQFEYTEPAFWTTPISVSTPMQSLIDFAAARGPTCTNILFDGGNYPGTVAGMAYVGGACSAEFKSAVLTTTSVAIAALAAIHELGHTFGAEHDTADACYAENAVMRADLTGVDQKFSVCSYSAIETWIASATCLGNTTSEWTHPYPRDHGPDSDAVIVLGAFLTLFILGMGMYIVIAVYWDVSECHPLTH